ncbi:FAD:protein FMN transferase [Tundrisphaera sp. TA3]|uniref:FAD:protein FMN transferase n=1 Tax=Tundrisphaera sp. TA3 TaxID=3435775 RepID=UPI003EB8530A
MFPEGVDHDPTRRRPLHRRDLFRLRARAEAMPAAPTSAAQAAGSGGSHAIINASRPGMGSFFEVRLGASVPGAVDLATRALDRIDELEEQLTVYHDDSEVSRLNARAHRGPVEVEDGLFRLLEQAVAIGRLTRGAYDVAAGALSLAWGFTRGPRRVPDAETLQDARERTGSAHLILDPESRTVRFARPGLVINLGSIGKGYAIDRAADVIRGHWWPTTALIHGGRSSLYALGSPPDDFGGRWAVALRDPADPERSLGTFHLRNRGMGTSGAAFQRFEANGREYGHIIDPRTGEPPDDGPASVTVLAPTAAEADALSTAFYLLGPAASATILAGRPDLGAVFVTRPGPDAPSRVLAIGLTDADFTPHPKRSTPRGRSAPY